MKLGLRRQIYSKNTKMLNLIKIRAVGAQCGRTEMMTLIDTFGNFAKPPKSRSDSTVSPRAETRAHATIPTPA
jgi:hypothetical protein